jgi:hypothetical protein
MTLTLRQAHAHVALVRVTVVAMYARTTAADV